MSRLLEFVKKLKENYIAVFGRVSYEYTDGESCVLRWARELDDKEALDILSNLTVRQSGNYVIVKYISFEVLFSRLEEVNYSEFWNMYSGIYRECRGTTIDVQNDCLVSRPFDKFFGINEREETSEARIREKLKTARVVEFADKLDGSIVITRWYDGKVFVSSSGMIEENYVIEKAREIITKGRYKDLIRDYGDYTVMFESIQPNDTHIVDYPPSMYGLHLIGMRNVETGDLMPYSEISKIAEEYGIPTTVIQHDDFDKILSSRKDFKAQDKEGYVMYLDGTLIKIKCDDYIMLHKMWNSHCSMNNLIEAVHKELLDDVMQGITSNMKRKLEDGVAFIQEYIQLMEKAVLYYERIAPTDRAEFFRWVKTIPSYIGRYVTARYLGRNLSYLTIRDDGKQVQYLKYSEMEKLVSELKNMTNLS